MRLVLRQYAITAALAASSVAGDGPLFLFDYALRFLRVLVLLAIWRTIFSHHAPPPEMPVRAVLAYTLIAEVFAQQLAPRTDLEGAFWSGGLAGHYTRPMSLFNQFTAQMLGEWILGLAFFSLPLLLAAPLLGVNAAPIGRAACLLFPVSLVLAASVGLALEFAFAAIAVRLALDVHALNQARSAAGALFSGAIVPLALLPWGLGAVFAWTPFAAMASAPLTIYTGTGRAAPLLLGQAAWVVALWPAAHWMWRSASERMISYNG